jgi:hypothetical protein
LHIYTSLQSIATMFVLSKSAVALTAILSMVIAAAQTSDQQITKDFRGNLSKKAEIYLPSNANWQTETIQRWTIFQPSTPVYVAAIKPATAQDVSAIVSACYSCLIPLHGNATDQI